MSFLNVKPVVTLFKEIEGVIEHVIVEIESEAEELWRGKGYSENQDQSAALVTSSTDQAATAVTGASPAADGSENADAKDATPPSGSKKKPKALDNVPATGNSVS